MGRVVVAVGERGVWSEESLRGGTAALGCGRGARCEEAVGRGRNGWSGERGEDGESGS